MLCRETKRRTVAVVAANFNTVRTFRQHSTHLQTLLVSAPPEFGFLLHTSLPHAAALTSAWSCSDRAWLAWSACDANVSIVTKVVMKSQQMRKRVLSFASYKKATTLSLSYKLTAILTSKSICAMKNFCDLAQVMHFYANWENSSQTNTFHLNSSFSEIVCCGSRAKPIGFHTLCNSKLCQPFHVIV